MHLPVTGSGRHRDRDGDAALGQPGREVGEGEQAIVRARIRTRLGEEFAVFAGQPEDQVSGADRQPVHPADGDAVAVGELGLDPLLRLVRIGETKPALQCRNGIGRLPEHCHRGI
ncbi:MAG: hypothetical protein ACR2F6_00725 [Mycobacteriales bacterium]